MDLGWIHNYDIMVAVFKSKGYTCRQANPNSVIDIYSRLDTHVPCRSPNVNTK